MRMVNKWSQLILGPSGKPRIEDVGFVFLKKDGTRRGKVLTGDLQGSKVVQQGKLWRVTA